MATRPSNATARDADDLALRLRDGGWVLADEYDAATAGDGGARKYRNCVHYYTSVPGPGPGGRAVAVLWCKLPNVATSYTPPPPALDAGPEPMLQRPAASSPGADNAIMSQVRQLANTLGINLDSDASRRALGDNSAAVQLAQLQRIEDARDRTDKAKPRTKGRRKKDVVKSTATDRRKKPRAKSALDDRRKARRAADATMDVKPLRRKTDPKPKPVTEPKRAKIAKAPAAAKRPAVSATAERAEQRAPAAPVDLTAPLRKFAAELPERLQFTAPKFTLLDPAKGNTPAAVLQRILVAPVNAVAVSAASAATNVVNAVVRDQVLKTLGRRFFEQPPAPVVDLSRVYVPPPAAASLGGAAPTGMHYQSVVEPNGAISSVIVPDIIPFSAQPLPTEIIGSELAQIAITDSTAVGAAAYDLGASQALYAAAASEWGGVAAVDATIGAAEAIQASTAAASTLNSLAAVEATGFAALPVAAPGGIEAALAAIPGWGYAAAAALLLLGPSLFGDRGPKPREIGIIDTGTSLLFSQQNYLQGVGDLYHDLQINLIDPGIYDRALAAPYLGYGAPTGTFAQTIAAILARIEPARVKPFPATWFAGWVARADARTGAGAAAAALSTQSTDAGAGP